MTEVDQTKPPVRVDISAPEDESLQLRVDVYDTDGALVCVGHLQPSFFEWLKKPKGCVSVAAYQLVDLAPWESRRRRVRDTPQA